MITPTRDGAAILFLRSDAHRAKQSLFEFLPADATLREIASPDRLAHGDAAMTAEEHARRERLRLSATGFASFELSSDGARVLLPIGGRFAILDRKSGNLAEVQTPNGVIDPHFSPSGKSVAYVLDHDLYVYNLSTNSSRRLTRGGTETVMHGEAEFIAQEELARTRGFWWSPDSKSILYENADQRKVERLAVVDMARPEVEPFRPYYPRAGTTNAIVTLGVISANGGKTVWLAWDRHRYPYVANVDWTKAGGISLVVFDRLQKNAALLSANPKTGATRVLVEEHDDAWVAHDASVPVWLPNGGGFLWSSERGGGPQLELRDVKGKLVRTLTSVAARYRRLHHVDAKGEMAYVTAGDEPSQDILYRVPIAGGGMYQLVQVAGGGTVTPRFGDGDALFVTVEGGMSSASSRYMARTLAPNSKPVEIPSAAARPPWTPNVEIVRVGADAMRVAIVRPHRFEKGRKYPVIDDAYGGPGHQVVIADASRYLRAQWIADRVGAIVVAIDAKGTPNRGRDWERAIWGKFGSVPLNGHVEALARLGERYGEFDMKRVGVIGWSFGGYFAARAALERSDVYKAAVAGAAPSDWQDYDTCYTERYLGMPDDGSGIYEAASLLTSASLKRPSASLLVIHGTADDNVYFSQSIKLAAALTKAGKRFEFLPLIGATHQVAKPEQSEMTWLKAADFLKERL